MPEGKYPWHGYFTNRIVSGPTTQRRPTKSKRIGATQIKCNKKTKRSKISLYRRANSKRCIILILALVSLFVRSLFRRWNSCRLNKKADEEAILSRGKTESQQELCVLRRQITKKNFFAYSRGERIRFFPTRYNGDSL